jgi:hypothetical protein
MGIPYRARVDERRFLSLPGLHGGAYVVAYVEDTSTSPLRCNHDCAEDCSHRRRNFEPRVILEIADCANRINLEFNVESEARRVNSLHKVDTLISTLRVFRAGLVAEFAEYDRRERELHGGKG